MVAQRLDRGNIPYMVSGSMAVNYYAQPRMTRDIDLVVELKDNDVENLIHLFEEDCYIDAESVREAIAHCGIFNTIHQDSLVKVDFIVRKESPYRKEEFRRRCKVDIEGTKVWFVQAEDLILSKLLWAKDSHSESQLGDVQNVMRSTQELDRDYLDRWARELDVRDLLEEAS